MRNNHYYRFSLADLESLLAPQFDITETITFDRKLRNLILIEMIQS